MRLIQDNTKLVSKLNSESLIDEELLLFLGLFHYATSFIYVHYKDLATEELAMIEKCGEYWIQLHKQYYDFKRMEVKIRYFAGKNLYDQLLTFGNGFIDYVTKNNFINIIITMPTQFVAEQVYIYSPKHDLKKSITLINQCLNLLKEEDTKHFRLYLYMKSVVYATKGEINYLTGDFDSALTNLQEALRFKEMNNEKFRKTADTYYFEEIGKVYNALGSYEIGLKYHLEVLRLRTFYNQAFLSLNLSNFSYNLSISYYQLIKTYLLLNRKEKALEYFEKMEKIVLSEDTVATIIGEDTLVTIMGRYKVSKSLILLHEGLFKEMSQAKDLLKEVIDMPLYFELISDALIPLIEIIVQEYKSFHNPRSLIEFDELSKFITNLYEKNNSIFLQINFLILQGKIAFINGEFEPSKSYYEKALRIAKDYNRKELMEKINLEMKNIEKDILNNQVLSTNKSRFNLVELENYVKEAFQIIKNTDEG